jgi:DNA-binding CsgD family transcriptional regulator
MPNQDNEVVSELRKITRMLAWIGTKDLSQKDKIVTLSGLGLQPKEVADLIGTTPNTVSVTLSNLRRAGSKKGN